MSTEPDPTPDPGNDAGPAPYIPLVWVVLTLIVAFVCCAGVGVSAYDSESAGVVASQVAAFPLGFALAGTIGAIGIHFGMKQASTPIRVGGPVGCGCLGGLAMVALAVLFFVAIFPAL